MALPVITSRPEKYIDGDTCRWNAANLPLQYQVTNTKWPTNSTGGSDSFTITGNADSGGYAELTLSVAHSFVAKEWVKFTSTRYNGTFQIRSIPSATKIVIDTPYEAGSISGAGTRYYNNYTSLINVYAGLDPAHDHAATKPMTLIGTIEQKPDTDNITYVDVKDYVKNQLNFDYDETQSSWPNDLNIWCDFYIEVAERYDAVSSGEVIDYTSSYVADFIYCKAVHAALQFGDQYGGNMFEYVIMATQAYNDLSAKWMTFFERPKIIDDNDFNISIIIDEWTTEPTKRARYAQYTSSGSLISTTSQNIADEDYGVYRLLYNVVLASNVSYFTLEIVDGAGSSLSSTITVDVESCG